MTRGGAHPRFHSHTHPQKRPIEYLSAVTPSFPFPHPLPSGDPSNIRVPSPSPFPHPLPRSDPSNIRVPSPSPLPHPLPSSDPSNIRPPSCPRFHSHTPPQKRPIEHPMAVAVPIPTPPPHRRHIEPMGRSEQSCSGIRLQIRCPENCAGNILIQFVILKRHNFSRIRCPRFWDTAFRHKLS